MPFSSIDGQDIIGQRGNFTISSRKINKDQQQVQNPSIN